MDVQVERTRFAHRQYPMRMEAEGPFVRGGFGRVSTNSKERNNLIEECVVPSPTLLRKRSGPNATGLRSSGGHRGRRTSTTQTDERWKVMVKSKASRAAGNDQGDENGTMDFHRARYAKNPTQETFLV
jgi:hypothetical protein